MSFLADGGHNFSVLTRGRTVSRGILDSAAFANYLGESSPVAPGPQDRITRVG